MKLRTYQLRTLESYEKSRSRSVCIVIPTGGGKTVVAVELTHRAGGCLFVVHTTELLKQSAERFRQAGFLVNIIAPGYYAVPDAHVHVATAQSLRVRSTFPAVPLIILDECHHYPKATDWGAFLDHYAGTPRVGLTATPQRQDGKPLGDRFDEMIVGAQYSELIAEGFLVPCRVLQPPEALNSDLAQDPVEALQKYGTGRAFVFGSSVPKAREYADKLGRAACIDSKMRGSDRDRFVMQFRRGELDVLTCYNTLTEGVDVPEAETCLLARPFRHVSSFLQACGRVLRSSRGKEQATVIDLVGVTHLHGYPTQDRIYTLTGKGIALDKAPPLRNCFACGTTLPAALMQCSECGYVFPKRDPRIPRIFNLELQEVFAGRDTPEDAKRQEYERLRRLQLERGYQLGWVVREYKKLFQVQPIMADASDVERADELRRLQAIARAKGFKQGWVSHRYKALFGAWPRRAA